MTVHAFLDSTLAVHAGAVHPAGEQTCAGSLGKLEETS